MFELNGGFDVSVRPEYGGAFTTGRDPGVVIRRAPCDIGQQIPRGVQYRNGSGQPLTVAFASSSLTFTGR